MKRLTFIILLISLFTMMGGTVFAGEGDGDASVNIRISISPNQGNAGTAIAVSGSGADSSKKVVISLSPQADSASGALVTTEVDPAADGSFNATLTVPADIADGHYAVRAEQFNVSGNVLQYYWNAFTVGSGGDGPLLPTTGAIAGTSVTISGVLALLLIIAMIFKGVLSLNVKPSYFN